MPTTTSAATLWQLDSTHSSAHFTVRHMMISNVKGQFSGITGSATLNPDDLPQSSVEITIDVNTINTHDAQRDGHLKSADFLDAENFPTMSFRSTGVEAVGEEELRLTGELTLHGVTKPVVLTVEGPTPVVKDPWGYQRWGASAATRVNRKDFGLTWNAALEAGGVVVGDELKIAIDVEFVRPAEQA